ncbi:hypothetical protein JXB27_03950 [Candidatus Woesearchaeota archaeon]|nr:hypothetical protein [Candidatus Woesearchaeota archaeon]
MKIGLFLILLLGTLVLSACAKESYYIPECDGQPTTGERDVCYNNAAVLNHNFRYCDKISTEDYKAWCIMMVERAVGPRPKEGWFD